MITALRSAIGLGLVALLVMLAVLQAAQTWIGVPSFKLSWMPDPWATSLRAHTELYTTRVRPVEIPSAVDPRGVFYLEHPGARKQWRLHLVPLRVGGEDESFQTARYAAPDPPARFRYRLRCRDIDGWVVP